MFDRDVKTIGKHINNALKEELLEDNSVVANFATTAADGKTYKVDYYNLDVIISVGYRVNSKQATKFRIWTTGILKEYMIKGFFLPAYSIGYNKSTLSGLRVCKAII